MEEKIELHTGHIILLGKMIESHLNKLTPFSLNDLEEVIYLYQMAKYFHVSLTIFSKYFEPLPWNIVEKIKTS